MLTENTPLLEDPPSPIERHVKWKMARTKRYGQITSKVAQEISENYKFMVYIQFNSNFYFF